jgi:hypothetical protein
MIVWGQLGDWVWYRVTIGGYVVRPFVIWGFRCGVNEIFWDVTQRRLVVTSANLRCVTSQKSEDLIIKTIETPPVCPYCICHILQLTGKSHFVLKRIFMSRMIRIHITKRSVMKMRWVFCEMWSKFLRMTWASNSEVLFEFFSIRRSV